MTILVDRADATIFISPERMMETVKHLSGEEFKGRGLGTPELDRAAEYIASQFAASGLLPGGAHGTWYQEWIDPELRIPLKNVVGYLPGARPEYRGQSVVIGAHYDHLGTKGATKETDGKIHPGADDNASGIAVLLEVAHRMGRQMEPERSVVFVAFTGEETGLRGSRYYVANEKRYPASKCIGMINLDTVGRLGKNKLIIIGSGSAREWQPLFQDAGTALKVDIADTSAEVDSSDQKSFQEAGVPAVQLFAGPHPDYHRPTDTADKIDAKGLVKIAALTKAAARHLAGRAEPLTAAALPPGKRETAGKERKVTLGIVPDFTYNEKGVRLGGVVPGGPAEAAGMRDGDVIVKIDASEVAVLSDLSDVLKTRSPGNRVVVLFLRQGKEMKVEVVLKERQ